MRRPLNLSSLVFVAFLSFIAGASTCNVPIRNIEFCRDKGKYGAICAYWLNAKETKRVVPVQKWNKERLGMICVSEKGMGNINGLIEKLCQSRNCVEKSNDLIKALE